MPAPVGGRDLVLDQRIHRVGIGYAQKRLGQAHQRHTFIGRKPILGQEHLHEAGLGRFADRTHKIGAARGDAGAVGR